MDRLYVIRMWGETMGHEVFNKLIGPVTYEIGVLFLAKENGFEAVDSAQTFFWRGNPLAVWTIDPKTDKPITATPVSERSWAVLEPLDDLRSVKLADNNNLLVQ